MKDTIDRRHFLKTTSYLSTGISLAGLGASRLAAAEADTREGHDLVLFLASRAALEDHVIDHREIIEECERRFGKITADRVINDINSRTSS